MANFSNWLESELNQRNMTPAELARASGKAAAVISRVLNGERSAAPDTLEAIARALKLPPETVFRAAGLLPPVSEDEAKFEDWKYLLEGLNERDLNLLRDLAEKMAAENEKERALKSLNPRRVGSG
jgi:transcriptional regulator with XRE-family HTH domain